MKKNIIFISGWGTNKDIWKKIEINLGIDFDFQHLNWNEYVQGKLNTGIINNSIVIGWSLGSVIGLELTLKFVDKVSKLILISPTARILKDVNYNGTSSKILESMMEKIKANPNQVLKECACNYSSDDNKEFQDIFLEQAVQYSVNDLYNGLKFLKETDIRNVLGQLSIPTLVIHGNKDKVIPLSQGVYLSENLKSSKLAVLNAGHDLPISFGSVIADKIRNFICI